MPLLVAASTSLFSAAQTTPAPKTANASPDAQLATVKQYCAGCHNDVDKEANLSLESLTFQPGGTTNFLTWTKIYERVAAGE